MGGGGLIMTMAAMAAMATMMTRCAHYCVDLSEWTNRSVTQSDPYVGIELLGQPKSGDFSRMLP